MQTWLRKFRNRIEGADFLLQPVAGRVPATWRRLRSRAGLTPFREAWWLHARHERYATLRRYARLLDWVLAESGPDRPGWDSPPHHARILVFRFGHLGDLLHLLPAIDELKRQRPDLRLELVTGPWNRGLAGQFNAFSDVHYFTPDVLQFHRGERRDVRSNGAERDWIRRVRGAGVDAVFCPSAPHFAELPLIVGLRPSCYIGGEWPLADVPVPFPLRTRPFDSRHYELDAVADYLPLFHAERTPLRLRYNVKPQSRAAIDGAWRKMGYGRRPLVVAFPGSGWPGKCWPAGSFARALDALENVDVALAGSGGEHALCERIRGTMKKTAHNVAGALSLDESAALIERAAVVLGNDSAPMHIAAALDRPTVSLWGPTFPEKWSPRGPAHRIIRAASCAGCAYWHPAARCEGAPPCMTTIPVDAVVSAIRDILMAR
jgi:heptosyltransferase-2/heptosyltransferase-3